MRRAFTLIELMISILILSIMMLFLYKSYEGLNKSNKVLAQEVEKISKKELIKKTLYLDFSLQVDKNSTMILPQEKTEDVVFLQTKNSVHKRVNPYVAYLVKEKKLYRLESLEMFKEFPLNMQSEFVIDELADVEIFRVYASKDVSKNLYLVHLVFKDKEEILLKIKALNF